MALNKYPPLLNCFSHCSVLGLVQCSASGGTARTNLTRCWLMIVRRGHQDEVRPQLRKAVDKTLQHGFGIGTSKEVNPWSLQVLQKVRRQRCVQYWTAKLMRRRRAHMTCASDVARVHQSSRL